MPDVNPDDKKFIMERHNQLMKPQDEIVSDSMANVAQSGMIGGGPQPVTPNLAASALRARSAQKFDAQINDMLQKQKYASYGKRTQNLGMAQKEALQDAQRTNEKYDTLNKLNLGKDALDIDSVIQNHDERMEQLFTELDNRRNNLANYIYTENVKRKYEADRNAMISSILGGVGMVAGAVGGFMAGGPAGAMLGGSAGAQLGGALGPKSKGPNNNVRYGSDY